MTGFFLPSPGQKFDMILKMGWMKASPEAMPEPNSEQAILLIGLRD